MRELIVLAIATVILGYGIWYYAQHCATMFGTSICIWG